MRPERPSSQKTAFFRTDDDNLAGRLLAVLQGHLHVDELIRWRETTFITGGAICGKWWRGPWHGTSEGFGVLNLRANRVDWEYFTYGWVASRPPDR